MEKKQKLILLLTVLSILVGAIVGFVSLEYGIQNLVAECACSYYKAMPQSNQMPISSMEQLLKQKGYPTLIDTIDDEDVFVTYLYEKPFYRCTYSFRKNGDLAAVGCGCTSSIAYKPETVRYRFNVPSFDSLQNIAIRKAYKHIWNYFEEPNQYSIFEAKTLGKEVQIRFLRTKYWKVLKDEDIIDDSEMPVEMMISLEGELISCTTNFGSKCVEKWK